MKQLPTAAICTVAVLVCCQVVCGEVPARNLLRNSSFETLDVKSFPSEWNVAQNPSVVDVDKTVAYDGKNSLHLKLDGKETTISHKAYVALTPGKSYTFSAWVKTQNVNPISGFQIQIINLGWTFGYQSLLPIAESTTDWRRYSKTFVVPPAGQFKYQGKDNAEYTAVIYAKGARGEAWVDALQLEEGQTAAAFAPAETPAAR